MEKIRPRFRWLVLLAALLLPIVFFVPIWSIKLWAPQYPEGLEMKIWINKLSGSVDIINDLNHYIGMGKINIAMFPEFGYMVYILAFIILFSIVTFIFNRRFMLYTLSGLLVIAAGVALVDFYNWGYYYGHHLNPMAAIIIEGQSYQPPLIGYKQLLNFTALSMPDTGGWILFGSGGVMVFASILELLKSRKKSKSLSDPFQQKKKFEHLSQLTGSLIFITFLFSCKSGAEPLKYGKDNCAFCQMKLVDNKYGAEIITEKGKVYKFDDTGCMLNYELKNLGTEKIAQELVIDYSNPGRLIKAPAAFHLKSPGAKSPMGSNIASFEKEESRSHFLALLQGEIISWTEIKKIK